MKIKVRILKKCFLLLWLNFFLLSKNFFFFATKEHSTLTPLSHLKIPRYFFSANRLSMSVGASRRSHRTPKRTEKAKQTRTRLSCLPSARSVHPLKSFILVTHVVRGLKKQISRKSTRGSLTESRWKVCAIRKSPLTVDRWVLIANLGPLGDDNHFRVVFRR